MLVRDVLRKLDLGSSVAEFDASLEKYFVDTQTSRDVVQGRADVVAGDKGTGKTALFRILMARENTYPELANVAILPAFNVSGSPIFQRLTESEPLDEAGYNSVWKTYILAFVGHYLLKKETGKEQDKDLQLIERILANADLRSLDDMPLSVFGRIAEWARKKFAATKSAGVDLGMPKGPSIKPHLEFAPDNSGGAPIRFEEALAVLDRALAARNLSCWVVLDRLDEAFQGAPAVEIPALRALLRVFLDLMAFQHIRLKLFVRRDLFRKVVEGGFVNLTHVNARKVEIAWDEDDLKNLLCQRIRENPDFLGIIGLAKNSTNDAIVAAVFPEKVDVGERKSTTWSWLMSRIRDGNGLKPPRNLIDLVKKAQDAQIRREEREENAYEQGNPLIGADALKRGLSSLSEDRVNDTLLAKLGVYANLIQKFRDGKAEHNEATLAETLGVVPGEVRKHAKHLCELGFLEQVGEGESYKIPILYRDGLNVTQGKAFAAKE
ncbi:MAG: hypothetical protein QM765_03145 [Myxococcales bacterium]